MGICWYCHWGWPKKVMDIYQDALKKLDGDESPLHYGPSHIVWADENFDSAEWCLEHFEDNESRFSEEDLKIVRESLGKLAKMPLKERCVEPEDYDDENPSLYPPPEGVEMTRE